MDGALDDRNITIEPELTPAGVNRSSLLNLVIRPIGSADSRTALVEFHTFSLNFIDIRCRP